MALRSGTPALIMFRAAVRRKSCPVPKVRMRASCISLHLDGQAGAETGASRGPREVVDALPAAPTLDVREQVRHPPRELALEGRDAGELLVHEPPDLGRQIDHAWVAGFARARIGADHTVVAFV
jgi:hypothetical protein